jgi:hypothetical protein
MRTTRKRNGVTEALFGGYVTWDGRKRAGAAFPDWVERELRVWLPATLDPADCGADCDRVSAALREKAERAGKKNVGVTELWRY